MTSETTPSGPNSLWPRSVSRYATFLYLRSSRLTSARLMPDLPDRFGPFSRAVNGPYESSSTSDEGDGIEAVEDEGESGTISNVDPDGRGSSTERGMAAARADCHVGGKV
jgi:hypothetical protein